MPRFAVLIHDHPFLHWDFLLEEETGCQSWRLLSDPAVVSGEIKAEQLPVHRLIYLDYEGPVSGGRGSVVAWDRGTFTWTVHERDLCEVILAGERWRGAVRLKKMDDETWVVTRVHQ